MFKKKKEELTDQTAIYHERTAPRWGMPLAELKAGMTISGFEGEGQLGNISIYGCSLMSVTYINIIPDTVYKIQILPTPEDKIRPFTHNMKLSWTKSSEKIFYAGFSLAEGESNTKLKQYTEMLRAKGYKPDYGNMRPDHIKSE